MRISDWSSDVCSSDLDALRSPALREVGRGQATKRDIAVARTQSFADQIRVAAVRAIQDAVDLAKAVQPVGRRIVSRRSEEHASELQSLMRISYAVFCLNKKTTKQHT